MRKDYTWLCDCGEEGAASSLSTAREEARKHVSENKRHEVFIDEYDLEAGELSGKYWKINSL